MQLCIWQCQSFGVVILEVIMWQFQRVGNVRQIQRFYGVCGGIQQFQRYGVVILMFLRLDNDCDSFKNLTLLYDNFKDNE